MHYFSVQSNEFCAVQDAVCAVQIVLSKITKLKKNASLKLQRVYTKN